MLAIAFRVDGRVNDLACLHQRIDLFQFTIIDLVEGVKIVLGSTRHGLLEIRRQRFPDLHVHQDLSRNNIVLPPNNSIGGHFLPFEAGYGAHIPLGRIDGAELEPHIGFHAADVGSVSTQHIVIIRPGPLNPDLHAFQVVTGLDRFGGHGEKRPIGVHIKPVEALLGVFLAQ